MSRALRDAVLEAADALGINRGFAGSRWRRDRLLILCYHGFALRDEHRWDPELFMSAGTFRRRLSYLREQRYNVLPLDEALRAMKSGSLPERAVVLTIDDGLYDFSAVAAPLLREFGFPATVYVSTYYVEHPWPVFNVMASYLLWLAAGRGREALRLGLLGDREHPIGRDEARRETLELLRREVDQAGLTGREKETVLTQLAESLRLDYSALLESRMLSLMRPDELRALDSRLVDLQLHTHRHQVPEDEALFQRELAENRAVLARAGRDPARLVHFCYPSGLHRPAFGPWLRAAGIASATTCEPGLASSADDLLLLPRFIDTERTSQAEFASLLSGLRAVLNRRTLRL